MQKNQEVGRGPMPWHNWHHG